VPDSNTDTFVALKLAIDNWRWADVPFYLRTGKRLPSRSTEIAIQLRRVPLSLFRHTPVHHLAPNQLVLRLQPNEGISRRFGVVAMKSEIRILEDGAAVGTAAAGEFRCRARAAIAEGGRFTVVLSGGSTPRLLFRALAGGAAGAVPWEKVHLFWGDERTLGPDHPESNFRMARDDLLSRVGIPAANIHRMAGEEPDPEAAARAYEAELRDFFDLPAAQLPRFDLVFLGMGGDGHTASLFPGSAALTEADRWVVAPRVARLGSRRITLTPRLFNTAACVLFLVTGEEKAATLQRVLEGAHDPLALPSQSIAPNDGELLWLVDTAAAQCLSPRS